MKIAHVMQWFELGGGESVALSLAARQRAAGHEVQALALADGPMRQRFEGEGIGTQVLVKRGGFDATLYPRMLAFLAPRRYAVVHTHDQQSLVYAAAPARLIGAVVVHTKHGDTVEGARRMWLRRTAAAFVHAFAAVSESTAETARRHREVSERKLHVVVNGVDTTRFRPDNEARAALRRELGLSEEAWLIGTVGRQEREKNPELLIRAAAPLLGPGVHLVLAGSGSLASQLARVAGSLPTCESIHLLGQRDDVPRLLAAFDVFALSSRTEGMPLGVLEAMATGLPVVATAVGGLSSVLANDHSGVLVRSGDEEALRIALDRLRTNVERAREMGRAGRALMQQRYSLDAMSEAYDRLYRGS